MSAPPGAGGHRRRFWLAWWGRDCQYRLSQVYERARVIAKHSVRHCPLYMHIPPGGLLPPATRMRSPNRYESPASSTPRAPATQPIGVEVRWVQRYTWVCIKCASHILPLSFNLAPSVPKV
uniref:Uncharacterized protein n=1 Tax=Eutreptiella gymnastica TaxID=73025 RepID=A0A7S1N786_9EUGL